MIGYTGRHLSEVTINLEEVRMVGVLVGAIDARDRALADHSRFVARISRRLGSLMRLPSGQAGTLFVGALLHDVGKLGLPDRILQKSAPLDVGEREMMQLHPLLGARMIGAVPELSPVVPVVKHHHERFDGGGYPDGLRGWEIPLAARIICVADAFDSITRDRSYRRGRPVDEALSEIQDNSGSQFDPGVVRALLRVSESFDFRFSD